MQIDIKEITEGKRNNEVIWICDFRYKDILNKPIRHIKPIRVKVISSKDVLMKKTIYYSDYCFAPLNGKDEVILSKVIAPFDNTGFRSYTGVAVQCFDDMDECFKAYETQVQNNLALLEAERETFNRKIEDVKNMILK